MNILITGGAGYIGSVAVKELIKQNHNIVVVDNLSKGSKDLVNKGAKFHQIDLINKEELSKIFKENSFDSIIHFGAYKAVGESMENAPKYSDNITGIINLLNCMVENSVEKIIFSSSAAVYGMPDVDIINENTETKPINFYGYTKLAMEEIIQWYHKIHKIKYIALRYFNVAGDGGLNYIDPDAQNIFPIIAEVIKGKRDILNIFGNDYDTRDGTCIRDYIHILDLVNAHILALNSNFNGSINLGTANGVSVKELVDEFSNAISREIPIKYVPRRAGDPAVLIASNKIAKKELNWEPKHTLKEMVVSTLKAYKIDTVE